MIPPFHQMYSYLQYFAPQYQNHNPPPPHFQNLRLASSGTGAVLGTTVVDLLQEGCYS